MAEFRRVSRQHPCPICKRPTWCTVSVDGCVAKCNRVLEGAFKVQEDGAGFAAFHRIAGEAMPAPAATPRLSPDQCRRMAHRWATAMPASRLAELSRTLQVTPMSLQRMDVGWATASDLQQVGTRCRSAGAWTFPMRDAQSRVVGIRLRTPDGFKYAVAGSQQGVFTVSRYSIDPLTTLCPDPLLIVEGPTDLAAALDMGYRSPIGRPSNTGLTAMVVAMAADRAGEAVIIPDNDADSTTARDNTRRGVRRLAGGLLRKGVVVRVVVPDAKDLRAWLVAGGNRRQLDRLIQQTAPLQPRTHRRVA